jgi:hypothetical protein
MAVNIIYNVPDWKNNLGYTFSPAPQPGFSQIYPGPDNYWYVQSSFGSVKRLGYDVQFSKGFNTILSPTESFVDYRVDINAGPGLTFSYDGAGSELYVTGLTSGSLLFGNTFTQGYFISAATSGVFEWISAGLSGTTGSIPKFNTGLSLGDSVLRESDGQILIGSAPTFVSSLFNIGTSSATGSGNLFVQNQIYLGDNQNRYIGVSNSNDVVLSLNRDFYLTSYTGVVGPSGPNYTLFETKTNQTTYERNLNFLSGLVSMNLELPVSNGQWSIQKPQLFIRSSSLSPTFSFTSSNLFLGYISGPSGVGSSFTTVLGLSGGGIQIVDGTEGQYKVLVSSTTAGHGIWATMVSPGTERRLPIFQRTGDFALSDTFVGTESFVGPTFSRTYNYSLNFNTQTLPSSITPSHPLFGSGTFAVSLNIPNVSATQSDFLMNKSSQTRFGTLTLLDENESFGDRGTLAGLLIKDISNTSGGPGSLGTYSSALRQKNNGIYYYLNSDRSTQLENKQSILAWINPTLELDKSGGYTSSYGGYTAGSVGYGQVFSRLVSPSFSFFHRVVHLDNVIWKTPTDFMTTPDVSSNQSLPSRFVNPSSQNGFVTFSNSFNFQTIRHKNTIFYNTLRDDVLNLTYNFDFSKLGYTGSLTQSVLRMDTQLANYIRLESGEFTGFLTQSTGLFVNPQFGSFKGSNVTMTASRQVGVQVAQEVGYLTYNPNGFVQEAYDFISARISNGSTESGIGSHVGYLAQSKLIGRQWDPFGRRFYDFGQQAPFMNDGDRLVAGFTTSGRTTPREWPTFSVYQTKPWGFYAERDKSNFGGGLMVNIGATLGTPIGGYLDIQGLTGIYNSSGSSQILQDLDGSWITVAGSSWGPILPQVMLRPSPMGLTPTGLTDGAMWYKPGSLYFYDSGNTYNLLTPTVSNVGGGGGLSGLGIVGNVPVWIGTSLLRGTSSIFVSNAGDGNVGINLRNFITPEYSLQVHTTSNSPTIALGLSGSILYQDGTNGVTGSVLMTDRNGRTYLYQLILPAPGLTTSYARTSATVGSGYLPLYVGVGTSSPTGSFGASEHQLGPIYTDEFGNRLSFLIRGQSYFSQVYSTNTSRNLTLTVPSLSGFVPATSSGVVEFLMDYGNQTIYGQKSFENRTRFQLEGLTAGEVNSGILNLLSTTNVNQNQRVVAQGRTFRRSDGTVNYNKSILTLLTGTFSHLYSRTNLNDSLSSDDGAVFWSAPFIGYTRNFQTVLNQVIGRYTESVLANNFFTTQGGKENIPNFIGQFDFTKISSTESNLNHLSTFIGTYKRTEFGHNLATQSSNWVVTTPSSSSPLYSTSSVNLMTGLFVNNQVGGLSWSYGSATYSIGVYTRQDVDNGIILNAYDFFSSRIGASSSLSRVFNHVAFYAQSKVWGMTSLDPTGRQNYDYTSNPTMWPTTFSYGWTSGSNLPWAFWSETDKSNFGGGLMVDLGATFGTSLGGWIDVQGLTGIYNSLGVTRTMTNVNGELVSVAANSWGPILPQIRLRPSLSSLTPSIVDGSIWYKSGFLGFVDQGNVYNLLNTPTLLNFSPSLFYSEGLTSIGGGLRIGAASTFSPGLVHTDSQTFSGDKTFFGKVYIGPTSGSGNGLFLFDGGSQSNFTGFVGPTALSSNLIYRLPSTTPTNGLYLRIVDISGGNYTLGWATAQGSQGPAGPIGLSPGTVSFRGLDLNGYPLGATVSVSNFIQSLTFGAATENFFGMVSTTAQSFRGRKNFFDDVFIGVTTSSTQISGIFLHDNSTFSSNYTGFVGPTQALGTNLVYIMPSATPSVVGGNRQFLTIRPNVTGVNTQTYSLDWFTLDPSPNVSVNLPGTFSGQVFTVSTNDNGKLFDITTSANVIYLSPPTFSANYFTNSPRDIGFEFRVRKADSGVGVVAIDIPEVGGLPGSTAGWPFSHLRRQNQTMEFKWNSSSQSWIAYTIDNGYIQPNTILGNFNTQPGNPEEYEVVDYNDSTQNALNYSQGSFTNDWLSGVIYSSIDPLNIATTSNTSISLLNTQTNQYVGINTPGSPGSGLSLPAFSLTRGKHLRFRLAATYSKAPSSQAEFQFILGTQKLAGFTYSIGGIRATASIDIDFNLKVRYGGASGSVYGYGSISFDELSSGATTYNLHKFDLGFLDVNLASTSIFDVRIQNQSGQMGISVNSSTLERLV